MTISTGKMKWWIKSLIALVVVCFVSALTVHSVRKVHEWQLEQEANRLLNQAQQDANPAWTEDDADSWLHDHDFEPVMTGEGWRIGKKNDQLHHFCVQGYRLFEKGGMIVRPSSVIVTFYFDLNHKFLRVESKAWPFEPPKILDPMPEPQGVAWHRP